MPGVDTVDVLIVGAGLAGLAAGLELTSHGRSCMILEARDRVGGRVHTVRAPFADGLHAEAGAEYINGGHLHVRALLQRYGLLNGRATTAPRLYAFEDQRLIGRSIASFGTNVGADLRKLGRRSAILGRRVPDPLQPWAAPDAKPLDALSVRDWLNGLDLSPITNAYLNVWHRLDYSIENSQISLLQFARDDRLYRNEPGRSVGRPREGMDALPRAMVAELGDSVRLRAPVTSLHQDAAGVTVELSHESGGASIRVPRVIVAVPATALRRIRISPSLPPAQQSAVRGLRYGTVVKVLMQFRRRFWLEGQALRGIMTDLPFLSAWDATRDQPGEHGILGTYTAGEPGRRLVAMDEADRLAWCLHQLDQVFPAASRLFEVGYAAVWDREPYTRGTYSYFAPGEVTQYAPVLAQPAGRLHFAGEHTDPWQATMNGAIASGQRAAREVLEALRQAD